MFNVSLYLEKFKSLGLKEFTAKDTLIEVIKKIIGIDIKREDIEYKNGTFNIKADPIVKSEIYLKKSAILDSLESELKTKVKSVK